MRAPFCLLALVALAACDTLAVYPPEGALQIDGVSLTADRDVYDNDSEVVLTLRNASASRVESGVLGCAILERRTDSGWTQDVPYNDRACIAIAVYIEPGDVLEGALPLDGVSDGTYRFLHRTNVGTLVTASFVVD